MNRKQKVIITMYKACFNCVEVAKNLGLTIDEVYKTVNDYYGGAFAVRRKYITHRTEFCS